MRRPVYILLCGLPGSGKSTLRKEIGKAFGDANVPYWELSTDDLIERWATACGKTYSEIFSNKIGEAQRFVDANRFVAFTRMQSVIHDQTNLTPTKRSRLVNSVPTDYLKVCLFVEVEEEVRKARLQDRPGKVIPPSVDDAMRASWQPPTLDEGWDVIVPGHQYRIAIHEYVGGGLALVDA